MAEGPFKITRSNDGLFVSCEFDAHYVNDEDAKRIRGYIDQLATENAKLQELVQDMWNDMCGYEHDCRSCEHYELYAEQRFVGECEYHRRMRELGIEV